MKAQEWPYCRICTRDLVNGSCSHCESKVPDVRPRSRAERLFGVISRQPGLSVSELAELLGEESDRDMVCWSNTLRQLKKRGAIRSEGGRLECVYYAVDATKIPRSRFEEPDEPLRRKGASSETAKAKARSRREKLRAEGLCTWCGKIRDAEGRNRCAACIEKGRVSRWVYVTSPRGRAKEIRRLRKRYRKNKEGNREEKRETYAFYKQQGICVSCHNGDATVGANCDKCAARRAESSKQRMRRVYKERVDAGLCVRCGGATDGKRECKVCRDRTSAWRRTRKAEVSP